MTGFNNELNANDHESIVFGSKLLNTWGEWREVTSLIIKLVLEYGG